MTAREIAWNILAAVNEHGELSHLAMAESLAGSGLSEKDRAFATRLVHGTLERMQTIDVILQRQSGRPVTKIKPAIRNLLRMSVYQLLYLERVPASAVCNEAVTLAKKRGMAGLAGFVNGVLRGIAREIEACGGQNGYPERAAEGLSEDARLCFLYSMPEWIVKLWRRDFPKADPETMMKAFLAPGYVNVRLNKSRASMAELTEALTREGAEPMPGVLANCLRLAGNGNPADSAAYRNGWFSIQDTGAVLAGNLLPLRPGMTVLDLCAAPGGKTVHAADELAALAAESGADTKYRVESRDAGEGKIASILEQADRVGLAGVTATAADATKYDPAWEAKADIVIADVPCSGLGVIGRKPDIKTKTTAEDVESLAGLQRQIVAQAVRYVRPGGYLSYSTCTVARAENEAVAEYIASLGMTPVPLAGKLPDEIREASERMGGTDGLGIQLFPEPERWEGFYIAGFRKPGA